MRLGPELSSQALHPPVYAFEPAQHEETLTAILTEILEEIETDVAIDGTVELPERRLDRILRRHPKDGRGLYSRSELIRGLRYLRRERTGLLPARRAAALRRALRKKPVRSLSGVAVVTVLTRPHPCPGRCVFCPNDVRMPKSYLSDEPGSQRAAYHDFEPYRQTFARLLALHHTGHCWDKVELIVLGGTWSSYPEPYQRWFLSRCFDALNDFGVAAGAGEPELPAPQRPRLGFEGLEEDRDRQREDPGVPGESRYNTRVVRYLRRAFDGELQDAHRETASWDALAVAQRRNETAVARCVGLVLETRPDCVTWDETVRLRRLGATRIQLGVQSLSDPVLEANRRGHDVATTRRAFARLRRAGFKIVAHWMPNLLGSSPERDREDFDRLFGDPAFRPDELKIYPCSLVDSAELMVHWKSGAWRPYTESELLEVLVHALPRVPAYCRVTRVVRDIPGTDIVAGNRTTNFRQVVEEELVHRGVALQEIRSREIRDRGLTDGEVPRIEEIGYRVGKEAREVFLQGVTGEGRLVGFLRLSLPDPTAAASAPEPLAEIAGSAMIREVHVYGEAMALGSEAASGPQHRGLGRRLIERAAHHAATEGFQDLAVISSVGTREYYRRLEFRDEPLYQHLELNREPLS